MLNSTINRVREAEPQNFSWTLRKGKPFRTSGGEAAERKLNAIEECSKVVSMPLKFIQTIGLVLSVVYAVVIVWLYATEPRSLKEVASGARVATGTYQVDQAKFDAALELFRRDQFRAARDEWQRADPAQTDPKTQFYIAYSFYREGWGRVYYDQGLFKQGLEAVNRAIALSPATLTVDDDNLKMRTAAELKAELEKGLERTLSDLNPVEAVRERK